MMKFVIASIGGNIAGGVIVGAVKPQSMLGALGCVLIGSAIGFTIYKAIE